MLSSFSLVWVLGLIVPGAPGGLGLFETTISLLLESTFSPGPLLNSVALYRISSLLAATLGVGLALRPPPGNLDLLEDQFRSPSITSRSYHLWESTMTEHPLDPLSRSEEYPWVSLVIPIYNEVESLPLLVEAVTKVLHPLPYRYEILCVDDGSQDGSTEILRKLARQRTDLKAILLRRNYGQTAAMAAGFHQAQGQMIVTMDGDLQNDPRDIPRLLDKLEEGYDLVTGWRYERQDPQLTRLLPSKIANWLIAWTVGIHIHDYGCSLKAYRAELIADMHLYGELHRFLPALAHIEGARIAELPVAHQARRYGQSKYGLGRTFRVLMDLLTISFIKTFLTRPMHIFGLLGLGSLSSGSGIGLYLVFLKLALGQNIGDRPLLILAVLLVLAGIQLFCFGLLAELLMRTYHESQGRPIYRVREVISGRPDTRSQVHRS